MNEGTIRYVSREAAIKHLEQPENESKFLIHTGYSVKAYFAFLDHDYAFKHGRPDALYLDTCKELKIKPIAPDTEQITRRIREIDDAEMA